MPSQDTLAQRLDIIRQFLHDRYHGVIPVTGEMVQAVMGELPARHSPGQPALSDDDEYLYHREQEDCHDR